VVKRYVENQREPSRRQGRPSAEQTLTPALTDGVRRA